MTPRFAFSLAILLLASGALAGDATRRAIAKAFTRPGSVIDNFVVLDDHRIFASRVVECGGVASPLRVLPHVPRFIAEMKVSDEEGRIRDLDAHLDATRTCAFVVMREDRIVYERYSCGFDDKSLFNSLSITKPIVATLVGIAVAEGRIASLDHKVARYRPELAAAPYGAVTLKSLLTMTSGMADVASLLPAGAQYYYSEDLHDVIARATPQAEPRNAWSYSEGDVQVLAFVLEAAVRTSLSLYLSEKLWRPLGMESDALWALDREGGTEKAFCCISARARDFARFGRLYLDGGLWGGARILPAGWAARAVLPGVRVPDGYVHRHLWWVPGDSDGDFYAYGYNGQYLYVNPGARVVIVKFSQADRSDPVPMFRALSSALKSAEHIAELDRIEAEARTREQIAR